MLIFYFDFKNLFSLNLNLFYNNRYFLISIGVLTLYSTFFFNIQELTKTKGLLRFCSYFAIFSIYFIFFPKFLIVYPKYFKTYIKFICNFGFFSAILGIIMMFGGVYPIPQYQDQLVSIISHPNNTSMIFTISVITTLYYYFWKRDELSPFWKYFYIMSIILQIVSQLLTLTRAGIIGMFIGILIFLIIYYRKKAIYIIPIILGISPFMLLSFFTSKGFDSFLSRFLLLIPAYYMIIESPNTLLWGYGFTNSLNVYQVFRTAYNVMEENIEDPHNSFVLLILMVGLPIALLISLFILKYVYKGLKTGIYSKLREQRLFGGFASCFILSIIIHCLFDSELVRIEYFTMTFFIPFIGLLYNFSNKYLISENRLSKWSL